jgi:predicted nucleotidyltransferase
MKDLEQVQRIVLEGLKGHRARVYLFGSWARGEERRISDIDVGIEPLEPLPAGLLLDLQDALDNSDVLYPVDLVNLDVAAPGLRERVLTEGMPWNG